MSESLVIVFFVALGILAGLVGRRMLETDKAPTNHPRIRLDIIGLADIARMWIVWVPRVLYITGRNIAQGMAMMFRSLAHRLEHRRHTWLDDNH